MILGKKWFKIFNVLSFWQKVGNITVKLHLIVFSSFCLLMYLNTIFPLSNFVEIQCCLHCSKSKSIFAPWQGERGTRCTCQQTTYWSCYNSSIAWKNRIKACGENVVQKRPLNSQKNFVVKAAVLAPESKNFIKCTLIYLYE